MGVNIKVLAERPVNQTLYYNHEGHLELRECIHDHIEDLRLVYTKEEFLQLSDHWARARKKYDDLGQPEPAEQNELLSHTVLKGQRLHHDRAAIEFTVGGAEKDGGGDTIHVHYRHNRIHLTKRDFYRLAHVFSEALRSYNCYYHEEISLSDPSVVIRDVARDVYIPWLAEYVEGNYPQEDPDSYWDMFLKMRDLVRPADIQRPDGGWRSDCLRTRPVPEDFDKRYLFTMLECIKKYGYGKGPFQYDYLRVQPVGDGRLEVTGSHRVACLLHLDYDRVPVVVTN